jgi:hypothetical protein
MSNNYPLTHEQYKKLLWSLWRVYEPRLRTHEIPLSWAVLIYGELISPCQHYFWRGPKYPPPPVPIDWTEDGDWPPPPPDSDGYHDGHVPRWLSPPARYDVIAWGEEGHGRRCLINELILGELRATGFEPGAPVDSPPKAIHPARWHLLMPDFGTVARLFPERPSASWDWGSSASAPDGVAITGIRVLPRQAPPLRLSRQRPRSIRLPIEVVTPRVR